MGNELSQNQYIVQGKYGFSGDVKRSANADTNDTDAPVTVGGLANDISSGAVRDRQILRDKTPLSYPINLSQMAEKASNIDDKQAAGGDSVGLRPLIQFTCFNREGTDFLQRETCYFPCPANVAFADNANLSTIDLGMFGAGLDQMANRVNNAQRVFGGANFSSSGSILDAIGKISAKGASLVGAEQFVNQIKFAKRIVENPFTNTTYNGAGVRTFTFNFKMIAQTSEDALMIKKIHELFRLNMYAGRREGKNKLAEEAAFLQYPSIWQVNFLTGITKDGIIHNKFLPGIFACYLQNFNATFNTTGSTWYPDGAPLEVDISMTYQEARALEKNDIKNLSRMTDMVTGSEGNFENVVNQGITNDGSATAVGLQYADFVPTKDGSETADSKAYQNPTPGGGGYNTMGVSVTIPPTE